MDMDQTSRRPESAARSLVNDLLAKVDRDPIEIPIPDKPGWSLRIMPKVDDAQMRRFTKASTQADGTADLLTLSRLVVAETCVAILHDGDPLVDDEGASVTFASDFLRSGPGAKKGMSNADMVSLVFGNPVHVMAAGQKVTDAVGEAATPSGSSSLS